MNFQHFLELNHEFEILFHGSDFHGMTSTVVMPTCGKNWIIDISLKLRLCAISMKLTIVIKILMHFCSRKGINANMSYYFPSSGLNATMFYTKWYVVCKTKYRWAYYKLAVTQHQYQLCRNDKKIARQVLDSDWNSKKKIHINRPEETGKPRPEICNITCALCNAVNWLFRLVLSWICTTSENIRPDVFTPKSILL